MSLDKPKQEGFLASDVEALKRSISNNLRYRSGKIPLTATRGDWLLASELAVRNRLVERWLKSNTAYYEQGSKIVYYLSMEFLMGRSLKTTLYNLELVEQPVAYHDIAGLEYVTKHSDVPIMSDESCFNSKDALRLVERRAIDYLNIKLMKCGGIREALKINAICEAAGIEVMLGCMVEESNLGITAAASLGAATRNITRADLDATFNMTERPFKGGIYVEDTKKLVLPDVPGFGFIGFDNE